MKYLCLLLLLSLPAQAKVRELSLDLKRMPFQRDFLFPDRTNWGHEVRLNADMDVGPYFLDNTITGRTYDSRFHYVAWGFDHGFHLTPWLDVIHSHLSEHAIDLYRGTYPVRDSYGVRIRFTE
jgi:hypothetical protein